MCEQALHGRAGRSQAAIQLQAEHRVRELRLPVGLARGVALLELEVVAVDVARPVLETRKRHNPCIRSRSKSVEEETGQREMTEVVGPELELETVRGLPLRGHHDPGVVDQQGALA